MTARRQPGSSFKPLVFALAMSKYPIGPDTPIYDVRTEFGNWEPKNFDGSFLGRMSIRRSLGYSRNIPAIKMLDIAGGEAAMVPFANSLGIASLKTGMGYGLPMAIGTAELEPLELAQAYSVLASGGKKRDATPILRIVDSRGNTLDPGIAKPTQVLSEAVAYLLSDILSNPNNRPTEYWNNALTIPGHTVAAKTGTSNADVSVGNTKKILPRDLWTAGYSQDITTIVWTGNLDGTPANAKADGLSSSAPIWKEFMKFALAGKTDRPFDPPESVYTAVISNVTGKLASSATPDSFRVRSRFAVEPTEFDSSSQEIEIDSLCNGKVTDATPPESVTRGILMDVTPVIEGMRPAWKRAIENLARSSLSEAEISQVGRAIIVDYDPSEVCPRPKASLSNISVSSTFGQNAVQALGSNHVWIDYVADNPIVRLEIRRGDTLVRSIPIEGEQRSGSFVDNAMFFGPEFSGPQTMRVIAVDRYGYTKEESSTVSFESDRSAPEIVLLNPVDGDRSISVYEDQFFNLRFRVDDASTVTAVNLYLNDQLFRILGDGRDFSLPINDVNDFDIGIHTLGIEAIDAARNRGYEEVRLEVLAR
ncbi:MAG TPA: penicillin-binding transpeptidase domain-containing protein [bacterium]|nr:penicillin-binding transpeptidase domain-containing protein [bacterium]